MSAGRSAKRGSSRQYRLGDGKGPGRRTSTKLIATEVLPYQPTRLAVISRTKTEITREQELQSLKEEARDIEARLRLLEKRIRDIEPGATPSVLIASVESEMCVGCGTCHDVCPAGAISVGEIAWVDPKRCTGCGCCVEQCPRGALSLHTLKSGIKKGN